MLPDNFIQFGGIGLGAFAMYLLWRMSANHIDHNTKALTKLEDAINRLIDLIEKKL